MRRAAPAIAALVASALTLAACATDDAESSAAPAASASSPAESPAEPATSSPGDAAGDAAGGADNPLSFSAPTTDGDVFDAAAYAGQDVVLWFWAPWCTICRAEAPQVAAAAEQVDGVTVVGVASSGTVEEMAAFVDETGANSLTHVADVPGDVWRQFEIVAQPTFVFIDDDGRTQTFAGGLSQAALVDAMRQLEGA